jgi:ribosomal protein S27E
MGRPENMDMFVPDTVLNVKCPECGETSPATEWEDTYVYCELCGDHAGIRCPKCSEAFEHVWGSDRFKDQDPPPASPQGDRA